MNHIMPGGCCTPDAAALNGGRCSNVGHANQKWIKGDKTQMTINSIVSRNQARPQEQVVANPGSKMHQTAR